MEPTLPQLTVLGLSLHPAVPSDQSAADGSKSQPCCAMYPTPGGRPASGRRPHLDRRPGTGRMWAAAPVLAIAATGFWAAEAHAQTWEDRFLKFEGVRSVEEGSSVTITITSKTNIVRHLTWRTAPHHNWGPDSTEVAEAGIDYYSISATNLSVYPGKPATITVRTAEDYRVEHDEHFKLLLNGTFDGIGYSVLLNIEILNDDRATVTVSDARAVEGDALEFTATISTWLHPGSVTLTPVFTNGTASDADYTASTDSVTIRSLQRPQTFRVSTTEDSVLEENETFTVGFDVPHSNPGWNYTGEGSSIAIVAGTGTIVDGTPTLTVDSATVSEGDSMTFTVTLDRAVSGGLTVTPSFTDVTASKETDYTENTAGIAFSGTAGEKQTFTVATTEDTDAEGGWSTSP